MRRPAKTTAETVRRPVRSTRAKPFVRGPGEAPADEETGKAHRRDGAAAGALHPGQPSFELGIRRRKPAGLEPRGQLVEPARETSVDAGCGERLLCQRLHE